MQLTYVLIVITMLSKVNCYNILGIFLYDGESHFKVALPLLKELSRRGHEITVLGYFPLEEKLNGYTDIVWRNPGICVNISHHGKLNSRFAKYFTPHLITSGTRKRCETILNTEQFQGVINTVDKYDIIITEFFDTNCFLYPVLARTDKPFIGFQSHALLPWTNDWVGNPQNPAYIPLLFLEYSNKMNFWERLENTMAWMYSNVYYNLIMKQEDHYLSRKHYGNSYVVDKDVIFNTSLILVNSHFSLNGARPYVPNVVEVGGVHIEERQQLPKHIEQWLNNSSEGVIYFSFGSMIKGHEFPEETKKMFLKVFSNFSQRILWKWESDTMFGKPDNVMIEKWMPQADILCHPKVKAFISHGGLLGITEAVHCGVPLILLPQFGDQFANAKAVEAAGGSVVLDYTLLNEESIYKALGIVLKSSFNKQCKELSLRFRDRPMPPLETAIYWIEYVARHGGAPHLKTAAVGMPYYQYLLLDVIVFVTVVLLLFMYTSYLIYITVLSIFKSRVKVKIS